MSGERSRPAPFNWGDHIRYVGPEQHKHLSAKGKVETVLAPGMEGVVLLSSFVGDGVDEPAPWRCRAQFRNGYQFDITPENCTSFVATTN
jgi:hypothetical protein